MLGQKAENTYYISALAASLERRVEQMQKFNGIDFPQIKSNELIASYNQKVTALQAKLEKINIGKKLELESFCCAYSRLREAAVIIKKYQQAMMFYRYLSLKEYNQFYDQTQAIDEHMAGILSPIQKKTLASNKFFLAGENFFDILQARKSIQSFELYLKTQLQFEVDKFNKPFMSRLFMVLLDPFALWSKAGWRLLIRNTKDKEVIIGSVMALKKICDEALSLNALQFYFLSQTPHDKKSLSLREREAVKELLLDPSIQKCLIAKRQLSQEDELYLEANWEGFFKNLYTGEQVNEQPHKVISSVSNQQLNIAFGISASDMLDKLAAIEDAEAACRHFGMPESLLETFLTLSKPNRWGQQPNFDKRTLIQYDEAMTQIQDLLKVFSKQKVPVSMTQKAYFSLLGYIDSLTVLYQNHEQTLSKNNAGKKFLFFITCLLELLSNFQINSTTNYNPIKEEERYSVGLV